MYAKRVIIGLVILIVLGGILTAVYYMAGGLGASTPAATQFISMLLA